MSLVTRWTSWGPQLHAVLRMVAAYMFILSGSTKLFAVPHAPPPHDATVPWMSQAGIGGILEFVGGALMLVGLFARPVAFVLSGMMAVAYWQFHFPQGFWPNINGGMPAVLYCFLWLYFSAAGAGPWSLDARRGRAGTPAAGMLA